MKPSLLGRFAGITSLFLLVSIVIQPGCSSILKSPQASPEWIKVSNTVAEEYSRELAEISPESGSDLGYQQYDARATVDDRNLEIRFEQHNLKWKAKLESLIANQADPEVLVDLNVLKEEVQGRLRSAQLDRQYGAVPFDRLTDEVFYSLQTLINEQNPASRKLAAVDRFKKYVNGFKEGELKSRPSAEAARDRAEQKIRLYGQKNGPSKGRRFYPLKRAIDHYLENSARVLDGIKDLLAKSGRDDWKEDFEKFRIQVRTYENWVRTALRPLARSDYKLPYGIYSNVLTQYGHRATPEEVRNVAREEFDKNLKIYALLAAEIAKRDGLKDASPKAVIRHLKSSIETDAEKIRARYLKADADLSAEIRRRDLVTLPSVPLRIRVASEAESRIQPVPHLTTPALIGNTGQRPEFVVPIGSKDKLAFDDFAFAATAKSLTAHEGRPGHDLQFSAILDRGVSIIRASYAFNSVNVEGWALYAEWLMEESMTLDEKMGLMMARIMRNARMFLDPDLHLGKMTPAEAKNVITEQVGMSPEWADLELERYMFRSPGQAPSYYYGYLKLRQLREETLKRLGQNFRERCFHDAILQAGLLPLETLRAKLATLKCS
jgi:uncharacterized protein (DUF885 family)